MPFAVRKLHPCQIFRLFLYKYRQSSVPGTARAALARKNAGQDVWSKTQPDVDANTSRANPGSDDSRAYCVAVYPLSHKTDIKAIIAVVAIPEDKFSSEMVSIKSQTLCPA